MWKQTTIPYTVCGIDRLAKCWIELNTMFKPERRHGMGSNCPVVGRILNDHFRQLTLIFANAIKYLALYGFGWLFVDKNLWITHSSVATMSSRLPFRQHWPEYRPHFIHLEWITLSACVCLWDQLVDSPIIPNIGYSSYAARTDSQFNLISMQFHIFLVYIVPSMHRNLRPLPLYVRFVAIS